MAILNNNPLVGASGNQGGYNINNSLRFRSSASAYLSRTPASNGDRQKWTFSGWVKRGASGVRQGIFVASPSGTVYWALEFETGNNLNIYDSNAGGSTALTTTALYRDFGAWYHVVVAVDTTQATASNRCKIYVNGSQVTSFVTANYPTQNSNTQINTGSLAHYIGNYNPSVANLPFDGYMADVNFIDGQALTPSSFGETDTTTGVWKPKAYTGTYGTNGFYLKFSDIATTSGSNAGLGKDFSGNSNYWTTNNISVTAGTTYDAMTDSPTNTSATVANYCVINPINYINGSAPTNANLTASNGGTSVETRTGGTLAISSGKWYFEDKVGGTYCNFQVGVHDAFSALSTTTNYATYGFDGRIRNGTTDTAYGNTIAAGDTVGIAIDMDSGKIWFSKNGTWQGSGDPVAGTNAAFTTLAGATVIPFFTTYNNGSGTTTHDATFGQRPFAYTPPTGFNRLNTFNLPTSTIVKGNTVMDATTYTGDGATTKSITNASGFKPDLIWIKGRSNTGSNLLQDSNRGFGTATKLSSNSTNAENNASADATDPIYGYITAANSNGFTVNVGTTPAQTNNNGVTYVGWQWQAGQGSTSSNTSGSITSTVSVNTTAGFSVVTYTGLVGDNTNRTIGHGLGVAPSFIIVKNRNWAATDYAWMTWHTSGNKVMPLNQTVASTANDYTYYFGGTAPTSTVFTTRADTTVSTGNRYATQGRADSYVAYCWAAIPGYSAFTSYTGNGSTDGPFVYLGFRPKFVMIKSSSNSNTEWLVWDSSRNQYNSTNSFLYPNQYYDEYTGSAADLDFLSNGFKLRNANAGTASSNQSGYTYIVAAWAENPFKNSLAR